MDFKARDKQWKSAMEAKGHYWDEILEQETREQLQEMGCDENDVVIYPQEATCPSD